jgi:hypothetical protein
MEFDRLSGEFTVPIPDNLHQLNSSTTAATTTATAASFSDDSGAGGNCYRLQLYIREDCSSIPYSAAVEGLELPGRDDVCATAVALLCYTDSAAAAAAASAAAAGTAQRCVSTACVCIYLYHSMWYCGIVHGTLQLYCVSCWLWLY